MLGFMLDYHCMGSVGTSTVMLGFMLGFITWALLARSCTVTQACSRPREQLVIVDHVLRLRSALCLAITAWALSGRSYTVTQTGSRLRAQFMIETTTSCTCRMTDYVLVEDLPFQQEVYLQGLD